MNRDVVVDAADAGRVFSDDTHCLLFGSRFGDSMHFDDAVMYRDIDVSWAIPRLHGELAHGHVADFHIVRTGLGGFSREDGGQGLNDVGAADDADDLVVLHDRNAADVVLL